MAVSLIGSSIPAVISAQCARGLPAMPATDNDWKTLHKSHVTRLQSAWGAALSSLGIDSVVIHSGVSRLKYSRDDQHWPGVATPTFSHWTPYNETPALLVISPERKPKLICERHSSFWDGPAPSLGTWDRDSFDIEMVDKFASLSRAQNIAFIGDDVKTAFELGIPAEQCNRGDVLAVIESFRTIKSDFEVASMRAANILALRGHEALKRLFETAELSEIELHHVYLRETGQTDFTVPYGNIVALGAHCGILHHIHYDHKAKSGDTSLLVDAGATRHGYASDITRTWVRGKGPAAEVFRQLLSGMTQAQRVLVERFTVGKAYEALHDEAHFLIADVLKSVGLVTCGVEEMVASGITRAFFPHGLGHSLGLQVHDVGMRLTKPSADNPFLRNTSVITAGQVVTIEPGLYFIPTRLDGVLKGPSVRSINETLLKELMPFGGIRIEDNILATVDGPVNLTVGELPSN